MAENSSWDVFYTPVVPCLIESYTIDYTAYIGGGTCCRDPLTGSPDLHSGWLQRQHRE